MTDCDLRGAENCRTLRARWVAAGFPIAGVLVITLSSRSRHLRNRTDRETTYVKARNAPTRRLHPHAELSTREVHRSCVQPRQVMESKQVRRLPVLDKDHRLVGTVAMADLAAIVDPSESGKTIRKISQPTR